MSVFKCDDFWNGRVVFCVDVGSTANKNFGWVNSLGDYGYELGEFSDSVIEQIIKKRKLVIGLEAPLFFEINDDHPNRKRYEDPIDRAFSAAGGLGALVTCMTHINILFRKLSALQLDVSVGILEKTDSQQDTILMFESLVTKGDKDKTIDFLKNGSKVQIDNLHVKDAIIGMMKFFDYFNRLPINSSREAKIIDKKVYSIIGGMILFNKLSEDASVLEKRLLVI